MLKEIKYGGFTANPNDHDSVEGDLAVAMNLVPEDGTVKPVLPPSDVFTVPSGSTIMCIHKTAAYTHYILWNETAHTLSYMEKQGDTYTATAITLDTTLSGVVKVDPIGNTLVVLADDGMHYILWRDNKYNYLGSHIPELDLQFYLLEMNRFNDGNRPSENDVKFWIEEGTTLTELGEATELKEAAIAAANKDYAYNSKKKRFTFPFFVRYGLYMYDESITMLSASSLMVTKFDVPNVEIAGITMEMRDGTGGRVPYVSHNSNRNEYTVMRCSSPGYCLCFRVIDESQVEELEKWRDIITHVRFYISRQFITYNQDPELKEIHVTWDGVVGNPPKIELEDNEHIIEQIAENPSFYFLTEVKPERLLTENIDPNSTRINRNLYEEGFSKLPIDFDLNNDTIVTREAVEDDFHSHDKLIPKTSFVYNSRVNLANVTRFLFGGFSPCCFWNKPHSGTTEQTRCIVVYEKEDGNEVYLESKTRDVVFDDNNTILWFFYPDERAKRAYFNIGNSYYEITLKPHNTLTGAYYFYMEHDSEQSVVSTIPNVSPDEDRLIQQPNKIYVSEVNNPFYFPLGGINSIGSGGILGLCAAVRPVSTGQMGYADLYVFASSGVWVAKINEKGTYTNFTLATGDICINPDSITQMETTVLFATARGIMLISGSQAQCISEAINDGDVPPENGMQAVMDAFTQLGRSYPTIAPFRDFLGGEDASLRMLYDYRHQRIIVYNPDYSYAYIYSLESHKWGMMESDIQYTINSYPDALAVTGDNVLVNYSDSPVGDGSAIVIPALLVTRPLTLDMPDVHKTVRRVLQRGMFRRWQGDEHMTALLYGSRDLYDWHLIYASNGERMQGFSGTPYKWFRVALVLNVEGNESITGATVELIDKYTGKPR